MKIIFIDREYQISTLHKYLDEKNIIISLKPHCSYILKKKEIAFYEINSFFDHKEWAKYSELNKKLIKYPKE